MDLPGLHDILNTLAGRPGLSSFCNQPLRLDKGGDNKILENRCLEERPATGIPTQFRKFALNRAVARKPLRDRCHITRLPEDISQGTHEAFRTPFVNLRIDSVHIAGRALSTVSFALKNENPVLPSSCMRTVKS